jgi:hypothetical protein
VTRSFYDSDDQSFGLNPDPDVDPPDYEDYDRESTLVYSYKLHFTS